MKKLATIVTIILCLIFIGCGNKPINEAAAISSTGITAYQSFDDVYHIIGGNVDTFSPKDAGRLRSAGKILLGVKVELYTIMIEKSTALDMVTDLPDLIPLYERAKGAYITANNIIMSRIDEFDREDQITLYAFQETCMVFDVAIMDAIKFNTDKKIQMVKDILVFVVLVSKIAAPLIMI